MHSRNLVLLLGLVSFLVGACVPLARSPLDEARALWSAQGMDDYRFTLVRNCFCLIRGPVVVEVRNGEVVSIVDAQTGEPEQDNVALTEVFGEVATIQALFDVVAEAEGAATRDVTYHPELGYPTYIYIDESEMIADEEIGYEVLDLVKLG